MQNYCAHFYSVSFNNYFGSKIIIQYKKNWCFSLYRVRQKNTPIWEGHSFRWGARRRTAVYVPFSVYTMAWLGEHQAFIVEEFIKNGRSPVATQRAFCIRFALGRREAVSDKKTIYRWVSNFRQTGQTLSEGGDTTGSCCHYT